MHTEYFTAMIRKKIMSYLYLIFLEPDNISAIGWLSRMLYTGTATYILLNPGQLVKKLKFATYLGNFQLKEKKNNPDHTLYNIKPNNYGCFLFMDFIMFSHLRVLVALKSFI